MTDEIRAPLIVLAAPRTGSSMVSAIIHSLGISMGDALLEPDRWNQRGYFEDRQLLGLHRVIGFSYEDRRRARLKLPAPNPKPKTKLLARYRKVIDRRARAGHAWGFKDPQFVFLAKALLPLFKPAPIKFVVTRRDASESIPSIARMLNLTQKEGEEIIGEYLAKLSHLVNGGVADVCGNQCEFLVVDYAEAIDNPGATVERIAQFVGTQVTPTAAATIDKTLYRQRAASRL